MRLGFGSRLPPILLWPCWVWTFVASETFFVIWAGVYYMPPDVLIEAHSWQREVLFGFPGGHPGLLRPMVLVNTLVVLGLWLAVRSARLQPSRFFIPVALTGLASAVVLATIAWTGVPLRKLYPPIKVDRVLELDDAGTYKVRELPLANQSLHRTRPFGPRR